MSVFRGRLRAVHLPAELPVPAGWTRAGRADQAGRRRRPGRRALDGHYARASHEAYALIHEALTTSGDIRPDTGELLIRLDLVAAPKPPAALCDQFTAADARYPGTGTGLILRYEVKSRPSPA